MFKKIIDILNKYYDFVYIKTRMAIYNLTLKELEMNETTLIDWNKPLQTKDGKQVSVLKTDLNNKKYPVVVVVKNFAGNETVHQCNYEGQIQGMHGFSCDDIINVPEETHTYHPLLGDNGYFHHVGTMFTDISGIEEIDRISKHSLAILKITCRDGKPVSAEIVNEYE